MLYLSRRDDALPTRFGFIVAKTVGGAVVRNTVRRRLRAVGKDILVGLPTGTDVVVRALPGFDQLSWATLHSEISEAVERGVRTR
jgi:ribonuclease P protein component